MSFLPDVSLYYFAGDFCEVLDRFERGEPQSYRTHDEVAALIFDLVERGKRVRVTSFVTPLAQVRRPHESIEVLDLGAADWSVAGLLAPAVAADTSAMIVAGFPYPELLKAVARHPARAFAVLASSYNDRGLKAAIRRRRLVRQLNDHRFEWVSNHGLPSTNQLASFGVDRRKLVPWDIPHDLDPRRHAAKQLGEAPFTAVYVGSLMAGKGVPDLIEAARLLQGRVDLRLELFGGGELEEMRQLVSAADLTDRVTFGGLVDNPTAQRRMFEADVVVVPSRHEYPEGFPLTMYEAIAARTPIVCSDHPMFVEHMVDGRTASTFAAGHPEQLASALQRTLTDPALYNLLSEAAPDTLAALLGSADYRQMILHWVFDPAPSDWIGARSIARLVE